MFFYTRKSLRICFLPSRLRTHDARSRDLLGGLGRAAREWVGSGSGAGRERRRRRETSMAGFRSCLPNCFPTHFPAASLNIYPLPKLGLVGFRVQGLGATRSEAPALLPMRSAAPSSRPRTVFRPRAGQSNPDRV